MSEFQGKLRLSITDFDRRYIQPAIQAVAADLELKCANMTPGERIRYMRKVNREAKNRLREAMKD